MPEENNWRDDLAEDVRDAGELKNLSSVSELARSHIEAQKTLSKRPASLNGDEPSDVFFDKVGKMLAIGKESSYQNITTQEIADVARRYKIHPRQLKPFLEEIKPELDKLKVERSEKTQALYKEKVKYLENEFKDSDILRAKASKALGVSLDSLKEELGSEYNNPRIQHLLFLVGSGNKPPAFQTDGPPKTTEGGEDSDKVTGTERERAQKMVNYISEAKKGPAYYDKGHKEHEAVKKKVFGYLDELVKYQKKTGEQINLG